MLKLIPAVAKIVGEYVDLATYSRLIQLENQIFTVTQYQQLQIRYEYELAVKIKETFQHKFGHFLKLCDKEFFCYDTIEMTFRNLYLETLNNLIDALELCQIFVTKELQTGTGLVNLCGKLERPFGNPANPCDILIRVAESACYPIARDLEGKLHYYDKLVYECQNKKYKEEYNKLTPLWKNLIDTYRICMGLFIDGLKVI